MVRVRQLCQSFGVGVWPVSMSRTGLPSGRGVPSGWAGTIQVWVRAAAIRSCSLPWPVAAAWRAAVTGLSGAGRPSARAVGR